MKYLLDTDICIYLINKKHQNLAQRIVEVPSGDICVSSITQAELEYGVSKSRDKVKNSQALSKFLAVISVESFDSLAAVSYGQIRADLESRGETIGGMDLLIAGHAKSRGYTVVTNNVREYSRIEGLSVENWV